MEDDLRTDAFGETSPFHGFMCRALLGKDYSNVHLGAAADDCFIITNEADRIR